MTKQLGEALELPLRNWERISGLYAADSRRGFRTTLSVGIRSGKRITEQSRLWPPHSKKLRDHKKASILVAGTIREHPSGDVLFVPPSLVQTASRFLVMD